MFNSMIYIYSLFDLLSLVYEIVLSIQFLKTGWQRNGYHSFQSNTLGNMVSTSKNDSSHTFAKCLFEHLWRGRGAVAAHRLRMSRVRSSILFVSNQMLQMLSWRSWQRIALIRQRSTVRSCQRALPYFRDSRNVSTFHQVSFKFAHLLVSFFGANIQFTKIQ